MKSYFAYGSNLWRDQMTQRCPGHHFVGLGVLKGFRWIISKRGYANIVDSPSDEVFGIVYEITSSDEDRLDEAEGVRKGCYTKPILNVEVNGASRSCLVYVDPVTDEGKPKQEYIKRINYGLSDAKLPQDYVECCIRKFIPVT